jgi:Ca-activated chloride channel family protein
MRRSLLAVLALSPLAAAFLPDAPAASTKAPAGALIVRPECFGSMEYEGGNYGGPAKRKVGGASSGAYPPPPSQAPSAPPAPAPAKSLQKIPTGRHYQDAMDQAAGVQAGSGGNPNLAGASVADSPDDFDGRMEKKAEEATTTTPPSPERAKDTAAAGRDQQGPTLDWGATVYLSNDDSMSLASAQRVLWAVMHDTALQVREIRAHELLNYFSFDTVTPDADQTFDVLASAEQHGDQLSLAVSVKGATPAPLPLDLTLLVDRSGSMSAEGRMEYVHRALEQAVDQLSAGDRVDVVVFDDAVCTPIENFVVGRDDASVLRGVIRQIQPEGSTDLDLGLREAYRVAKSHEDTHGRNRRMMVVTDAQLNTGDVNPDTVSEIGKAFESDGIRLTGVGVGTDFNDKVLDLLTEKGKGAYVYLGSDAVVDRLFGPTGFGSLVQTVAHDVHFSLNLPDSLAMERFYGEESSTVKEDVQPVNYYAGTTQVFLQDLVVKNGRTVKSDPVELVVEYRDAKTGEPRSACSAPPWARCWAPIHTTCARAWR